ncbi:MAG: type II toxin-antitoxin system RelE/ParE family toxin [Novosphingobium sp.]|nr:type II toxin-antitoxin system RelE/ParE family toxin [Novosphingobium sp.]
MREVTLRPQAGADIENIADYTIERWGCEQAQSYAAALRRDIESLANFPLRHPLHERSGLGLRHMPSGHHLIFYLVTETEVGIVRVLHERMDAGSNLD